MSIISCFSSIFNRASIIFNCVNLKRFVIVGAIVIACSAFTISSYVDAARSANIGLSSSQRDIVNRITNYFNGFNSLEGDFIQTGPKGHVSRGKFYINKPGKLRFQYHPPNPFVVVSDGRWVIVNDTRTNTADHYPLSATPLEMVLAKKVDLLKDAKVLSVKQTATNIYVRLEDKGKLATGQLILNFDRTSFALKEWVVIDGDGNRTQISLLNLTAGGRHDPKLFEVRLPKKIELGRK